MKHIKLITALILTMTLGFATSCDKEDDNDDELLLLAIPYIWQASAYNQPFVNSCMNSANNECRNYFGTETVCDTTFSNEVNSTSQCTSTDAIGACRATTTTEIIYYSGNTNCTDDTTCEAYCISSQGALATYNADYTGT